VQWVKIGGFCELSLAGLVSVIVADVVATAAGVAILVHRVAHGIGVGRRLAPEQLALGVARRALALATKLLAIGWCHVPLGRISVAHISRASNAVVFERVQWAVLGFAVTGFRQVALTLFRPAHRENIHNLEAK